MSSSPNPKAPPSPSSVRWQYENFAALKKEEEEMNSRVVREIPSSAEMQRRFEWRRTVEEDIREKRRVFTPPKFIGNSILAVLKERSLLGTSHKNSRKVRVFSEYKSVTEYKSAFLTHLGGQDEVDAQGQRPASSPAVSTISVAFSPCGKTMASTHGDHTVKISDCNSGHLLSTLEGHPRTPWTCKYHPIDSNIVASGCLGHQVRIWDWTTQQCLAMIRLEFAIISLSFHPTGKVLAIANGTRLHFWGLDKMMEWNSASTTTTTTSSSSSSQGNNNNNSDSRGMLTEVEQRHMLRCVHFTPAGNTVIVGGVNPADTSSPNNRPRRGGISGGGMSFYLRLWDFDLQAALEGSRRSNVTSTTSNVTLNSGVRRRAICNPRTFVPRALLYNDGGFDVSPDGSTICACAEYWLPEGVDNAIELLESTTQSEEEGEDNDDDDNSEDEEQLGTDTPSPTKKDTPISTRTAPPFSPTSGSTASSNLSPPRNSMTRRSASSASSNSQQQHQQPVSLRTPTPQTPPPNQNNLTTLSPPSPPGRRFAGGFSDRIPPPPGMKPDQPRGRFVPHVVTISLDTSPSECSTDQSHLQAMLQPPNNPAFQAASQNNKKQKKPPSQRTKLRPRLGQLLQACPLDGAKASAVTCVKFSPSTHFCLIGYGVREPIMEGNTALPLHPVTALYATQPRMTHVSTFLSADDDVNIARFHPQSGTGFCYGTKQGRVKVSGPRPWNYYNC